MVNYWTLWDDKHSGFMRKYSSQGEFGRERLKFPSNLKRREMAFSRRGQ